MKIRPATLLLLFALAACQTPAGSSSAPSPAASQSAGSAGRIVFGRYVPTSDEWLIFTINPDGTDERELVLPGSNGGPRWSPDGSRLMAYADTAQGLLFAGVANADGSDWAILNSPDPTLNLGCQAWSPDGLRLACEGLDDADPSRNGVYTVRASDGADLVRLSSAPPGFHDIPADYSPDGTRLLVGREPQDDGIEGMSFIVNVDGTGLEELSQPHGRGRWAPDGTGILVSDAGKLFVLDASGENAVPIHIQDEDGFAFASDWSPDASQIVFSYTLGEQEVADLFTVNRDGTALTRLSRTTELEEDFADWSP